MRIRQWYHGPFFTARAVVQKSGCHERKHNDENNRHTRPPFPRGRLNLTMVMMVVRGDDGIRRDMPPMMWMRGFAIDERI